MEVVSPGTMNDFKLDCKRLDECGDQEIRTKMDALPDLYKNILQLLNTRLCKNSIMVLQEELSLMQKSSYYLEIQREDLPPLAGQQHTLRLTDGMLWSLIDQRRLQHAMTMANSQVKLLLTLLEMLYQEIIRGCQELEAFVIKYEQGLVDSDLAASMQQKLKQIHRHMRDFESRMIRNLGPLNLQNQLISNTGNFPIPQLSASLAIKMPVLFDRLESRATSNSAHLYWAVAGEQLREPKEPNQQFEIHIKSLHPTVADQDQFTKSTFQSYNIQISNLIPDRCYQFSVKRVDAVNLVYGLWVDTIILKTLAISK